MLVRRIDEETAPFSTVGYLTITRDKRVEEAWEHPLNQVIPVDMAEGLGE